VAKAQPQAGRNGSKPAETASTKSAEEGSSRGPRVVCKPGLTGVERGGGSGAGSPATESSTILQTPSLPQQTLVGRAENTPLRLLP